MGELVLILNGHLLSSDGRPLSGMCGPRNPMCVQHTHVVQVGVGCRGLPGPGVPEGGHWEPAFWAATL